jgi:hypothetical protein
MPRNPKGDGMATKHLVVASRIAASVVRLRGHNVLLDADLAALYGVTIKALNQAVKRNAARFPGDFMFQLTAAEATALRSQIVTLEKGRGSHRKYRPYAFTEQGVAMLSSVLRSRRAVLVNVEIMRAFVRLRQMLETHADLAQRLDALEKKYDSQFKIVFEAIRELMVPPEPARRRIGFRAQQPERTKPRSRVALLTA